jgi:acetyltransferase-like isoleucine patch superfamily enzyme
MKLFDAQRIYRVWRRVVTLSFYSWRFGKVGRGFVIYPPTHLSGLRYVIVGDNVMIRSGVRIEAIAGYGYEPQIVIGDNVNIEQDVHIVSHRCIRIGSDVSITARCAIVDVTHGYRCKGKIGEHIDNDDRPVSIGDGCFLGIGAVILPGVCLGSGCVVGANAVVNTSFPERTVVVGVPARSIRRY